jgi:eukaryotic-like serine/threonine-protein kinase
MTPERWQQIKGVLEQALELAPEERSAFLDRSSPDLALRKEVETLLSASNEVRSSFLESSTLHVTLTPGTKLGDYEVQKLLGSGGMGEVYRARDLRLRRDVAIKVLPSFLSSDKERLRRFEQEAQAAAALNHPNILAVFQMGTYEGSPYLVSELLEGETLREEIKRGPLPARKVIEQGVQIAHGLAAAHEKGIVHRDLKPENLFTTKDGRIKILDFGLAKLKQPREERQHSSPTIGGDGTEPGMVMGTAGYMSPEQVRGKPADHRADIFAFGTILYEMLTGRRAFQKTTSADTMSAILNEEPPTVSQIAPNIPPALHRTVHRCLEKPPEQRFQSASDLAFALEALSDSTASSLPAKFPNVTKSHWHAGIIAIANVVLAGAALMWLRLPPPVPMVQGVRQLTDDGEPKSSAVTDGLRVYFGEGNPNQKIAEVSVNGGQTALLPMRFKYANLQDLVPDASALLIVPSEGNNASRLWLQPLPAGEPRDLGIDVDSAVSAPEGRIFFTLGTGVFIAEKDGSNPRKLGDIPGHALTPVVSPDGKRVRLTLAGDNGRYSIWELRSDGTGLHELLKTWPESVGEQTGAWTQDGKYFIFEAEHGGRWDLWALPENGRLFQRSLAPIRLTNGPLSYESPVPSRDGKEIFAVGSKKRGELVRYDPKSRQFTPYLSGISAIESRVSRDGKWVVYVSYPDHSLWRTRPDGSERAQLTFPPMMVFYPEISPDGSRIAFNAITPESVLDIYVVSTEGGTPQKVISFGHAPAWSPDGNSLAYGAMVPGAHVFQQGHWFEIHTIDLRTKRVSVLASPENRFFTWWPKPDSIVTAGVDDNSQLFVFDLKKQQWTRITGPTNSLNWTASADGKSLYLLSAGPAGQKVLRIGSGDFKLETVADLANLRLISDDSLSQASSGNWIGIAADGSPTLTRDVGSDEIYALDVKWP